jgi:hypothetical protein
MTRRLLLLILFLLLSSSKTQKIEIDGVWILAYSLTTTNSTEPVYVKTMMDFKNDSVSIISVGDMATGDLSIVQIEKFKYKLKQNQSVISFASQKSKLFYTTDTLTLQSKHSSKLVFKRLHSNLKTKDFANSCFAGAYVIRGGEYQDSLCFINDSTLILTGSNDMNSPTKKWNIVKYKGYQFLNIQDILNPLTVSKSCSPDQVKLVYHYQKEMEFVMEHAKQSLSKEKLFGQWAEIPSTLRPPPAPARTEGDQYYHLTFEQELLHIKLFGRIKSLKWDLTADGKRIYFKDKLFQEDGSWKLLEVTDTTMTIMKSRNSGLEEVIVKLKRIGTEGESE